MTSVDTVPAIALNDIKFGWSPASLTLDIPSLTAQRGEHVFLHGPSGSGKTTLLGLLSGILAPKSGTVRVLGTDLARLSNHARDSFRGAHLGYIFQMFNLVPYFGVMDNILLACRMSELRTKRIGGHTAGKLEAAAQDLAKSLGIADLLSRPVVELSVGQQQRVAAARALLGEPEIVIADEPTSALDTDHRQRFLELLFKVSEKSKSAVVFVSHDQSLKSMFHRVISLPEVNRATRPASGGTP